MKPSKTKLDAYCLQHGITTVALAARTKLSRKHVGNVRSGKARYPGLQVAFRIAQACAAMTGETVDVADLFEVATASKPMRRSPVAEQRRKKAS